MLVFSVPFFLFKNPIDYIFGEYILDLIIEIYRFINRRMISRDFSVLDPVPLHQNSIYIK